MLAFGILFAIAGGVFGFRWFSAHKFEYIDGVKPSQQLDENFWLCIGLSILSLALMTIGAL